MKRFWICILLSISITLLAAGCSQKAETLSAEEAAIRNITDAAVMEKYHLDDLADFRINAYNAPNGNI